MGIKISVKTKIILIILALIAVIIVTSLASFTNILNQSKIFQENSKPENATIDSFLGMCLKSESAYEVYNCTLKIDDIKTECKSVNELSYDMCKDTRMGQFSEHIKQLLEKQNTGWMTYVNECMNATDDILSCNSNLQRIKNDCEDKNYSSIMSVCNDPALYQFSKKYNEIITKLNSTG